MNISKAIEIKERKGEEFLNTDPDELDEADRLSIKALERIQKQRNFGALLLSELLPGETED